MHHDAFRPPLCRHRPHIVDKRARLCNHPGHLCLALALQRSAVVVILALCADLR